MIDEAAEINALIVQARQAHADMLAAYSAMDEAETKKSQAYQAYELARQAANKSRNELNERIYRCRFPFVDRSACNEDRSFFTNIRRTWKILRGKLE